MLLVDDEDVVRRVVKRSLKHLGYGEADEAESAEEGLKRLQGASYALLITDIHMRAMNGIELIKKIRTMPGLQFVPILVVTTESQQSKRDEARAAKATGWLVKPVQPDDLVRVVKQILPNG